MSTRTFAVAKSTSGRDADARARGARARVWDLGSVTGVQRVPKRRQRLRLTSSGTRRAIPAARSATSHHPPSSRRLQVQELELGLHPGRRARAAAVLTLRTSTLEHDRGVLHVERQQLPDGPTWARGSSRTASRAPTSTPSACRRTTASAPPPARVRAHAAVDKTDGRRGRAHQAGRGASAA